MKTLNDTEAPFIKYIFNHHQYSNYFKNKYFKFVNASLITLIFSENVILTSFTCYYWPPLKTNQVLSENEIYVCCARKTFPFKLHFHIQKQCSPKVVEFFQSSTATAPIFFFNPCTT